MLYSIALVIVIGSVLIADALVIVVLLCVMLSIPIITLHNAKRWAIQSIEIQRVQDHADESTNSTQMLDDLLNSADIPILATNHLGYITHLNTQAERVLGLGTSMHGRAFDEIMTQGALHELEAAARSGEPGHARLALAIAGEIREFDVSADPMSTRDSQPRTQPSGAVLTFRDITELSRAMTLKADFVANASHELRTPIASIKAAAETLSGSAKDDPIMSVRLIEMISSNATRLEMLASDLLDLSKLEAEDQPAQIESITIIPLIDRLFAGLSPIAERRHLTLAHDIEDGLDTIDTDPMLIGLILQNLVGNAIKFAHENTQVLVKINLAEIAPDRTAPIPNGLNQPVGISLSVIDEGIGIPLAQQQRVFERFFQVDDARSGSGATRGTGLGLAIVKHAARRLGGTVGLESVHQVGTRITVQLPRCATAAV